MKYIKTIHTMLIAVVSMFVAFDAYAEYYAEQNDARKAMVDSLVGKGAKVVNEMPFAEKDNLPLAAQKIDFMFDGGSSYQYRWTDYAQKPSLLEICNKDNNKGIYSADSNKDINVEDYNVVAVGKNRGAADNIFTLRAEKKNKGGYFKWTLYKKVAGGTETKKVEMSEDLSAGVLGGGQANDFVENYDFLKVLRLKTKYDPINGYVSNNVRRNEIFQSMAAMVTCDWNNNGTEDVYVVAGGMVTIFDGNTLDKLAQFRIGGVGEGTEVSVSAVAGDFRQTGRKEVLVMCLAVDENTKNMRSGFDYDEHGDFIHGVRTIAMVIPNSLNGKVQTPIYRNISTSDVASSERYMNSHPTINIECFYPDGSLGRPVLVVATNMLDRSHIEKPNYTVSEFIHTLSLLDVDYRNTSWYSVLAQENYRTTAATLATDKYGIVYSVDHRDRPFLFGRPALKQAFMLGADAPAYLFWNSMLGSYNKDKKYMSWQMSVDIPNSAKRKGSGNPQFDHVIGGNVATVSCPEDPNDIVKGREWLVFPYSGTYYISDGTIHKDHDWKDAYYGIYRFSMSKNNTGFFLHDGMRQYIEANVYLNSPINVTAYSTEPGMEIHFVSKDVTVTTPTIQYVLATPPFESQFSNKGKAKASYSESKTEGSSESATSSVGNSVSMSVGFSDKSFSIIKCSVAASMSNTWSESRSISTSTSQGMSYSPTEEKDFVVFNYQPLDRFVYEIADSRYPELNGKTIALTKVRGAHIAQTGMTVEKYNAMVKDAGGYVIGKDVLSHTIGSVSSYKGGDGRSMGTEEDVRKAFGLADDDYLLMSGIYNVTESSIDASPKLTRAESESSTSSQSTSTSVTTSIGTDWSFPISLGWTVAKNQSKNSSITTNWSNNVVLGGTVPGIRDLAAHNYSYRLVWYQHKDRDTNGDANLQDFMVCNWYIVENAMQNSTVETDESIADNALTVDAGNNVITVSAIGDVNVVIANLQGVKMVEKIVNGTEQFNLPAGFYVVKAGNTVKKVMLQ